MLFKNKKEKENKDFDEDYVTIDSDDADEDDEIEIEVMKQKLSLNKDIIFDVAILDKERTVTIVFVDGMVDYKVIDDFILKPLLQEKYFKEAETEKSVISLIMSGTIYHCQRQLRDKLSDCYKDLLSGSVVLIFEKSKKAVTFEVKGFEKRGITEPSNESVLKGSKESFIEVLSVNTALVRRRIPSCDLTIEQMLIGQRSNTAVSVLYLRGIANQKIVDEVKQILGNINIDSIYSVGAIEAFLVDNDKSIFPQLLFTERPEKFCAGLLEGRIGVLIDGFPIALYFPIDINSLMQAPEDYSKNYIISTTYRILRYVSTFISLILPGFYVSVTTYHQQMIPTKLASAIIESKAGVPLPSYLEVVLMLIAFEVLLEAGVRMPKSIGQAVSIVGAIVVGEAAITANILSPSVVIIIAASGITGFIIPSQDLSNTVRILRLILVGFSIPSGLFGLSLGIALTLYMLCDLEVFGVPYLSPFVSCDAKGIINDTLIKLPWSKMKERPGNISPEDSTRQG